MGLRLLRNRVYENKSSNLLRLQKIMKSLEWMQRLGHNYGFPTDLESESQLGQDIFVLKHLNWLRDGIFVEVGAASGKELSNTYLLEKRFGWTGILSEPARSWRKYLSDNRDSPKDFRCVWAKTGERKLFQDVTSPEYSTLVDFQSLDMHSQIRRKGSTYEVETISLDDLLTYHQISNSIDYLSIDTEGSEFAILQNFDFRKWDVKILTVEHNFTQNREKIFSLMTENGYLRVHVGVSHVDDWFLKKEYLCSTCLG